MTVFLHNLPHVGDIYKQVCLRYSVTAMRYRRIGLIAVFALIATVLPLFSSFHPLFPRQWLLAQTVNERKAEADNLLQQGLEQGRTSQFVAALQSFQQGLIIYQEIKDREGEGMALI